MFIIFFLLLVLVIIYILTNSSKEKFVKYPYNPYHPSIPTPQTNYDKNIELIDKQQAYKNDLSLALSPTPTVHCPELQNKTDCNKYGCNWYGSHLSNNTNNTNNTNIYTKSFCSSTYPTQI